MYVPGSNPNCEDKYPDITKPQIELFNKIESVKRTRDRKCKLAEIKASIEIRTAKMDAHLELAKLYSQCEHVYNTNENIECRFCGYINKPIV